MFLKYVGTSDYREFTAADFKRLGAEANKTKFVQHEVVEVPDDTGAILVGHELLKGDFEEVDAPENEEQLILLDAEAHEKQSPAVQQAEGGGGEVPATTARSGGATDADTTGTRPAGRGRKGSTNRA